jgi:hypothetical protein
MTTEKRDSNSVGLSDEQERLHRFGISPSSLRGA